MIVNATWFTKCLNVVNDKDNVYTSQNLRMKYKLVQANTKKQVVTNRSMQAERNDDRIYNKKSSNSKQLVIPTGACNGAGGKTFLQSNSS